MAACRPRRFVRLACPLVRSMPCKVLTVDHQSRDRLCVCMGMSAMYFGRQDRCSECFQRQGVARTHPENLCNNIALKCCSATK